MSGESAASLGWLADSSEPALRAALRAAAPEIAELPIEVERVPDLGNPTFASGRARVGRHLFAKFACSESTAVRLWREAQVLELLGELGLPVPNCVAAGRSPVVVVTESVGSGAPLAFDAVASASEEQVERLAAQLARFLSRLHAAETLALFRARVDSRIRLPDASLHVSTDGLRARFTPIVERRQRPRVARWCDWIDDRLAAPGDTVFVHGDLHPYNQLWDLGRSRLIAVLDFETSGLGEPEFDLRVLPAFGPGVELLVATAARYEALTARTLSMPRTMALYLLNYLGDALWRTEAGIDLPGPGATPSAYVEEAARRMSALGIEP